MICFEMSNTLPQAASSLRLEVFVKEQGFCEEFDQFDEVGKAYHFVLFEDKQPLATCRMIDEGDGVFHIGRVAVKKDCRKRGLGAKVIAEAEDAAKSMGGKKITIGSQVQALGFYKSLGYIQCSGEYTAEGKSHIDVYKEI